MGIFKYSIGQEDQKNKNPTSNKKTDSSIFQYALKKQEVLPPEPETEKELALLEGQNDSEGSIETAKRILFSNASRGLETAVGSIGNTEALGRYGINESYKANQRGQSERDKRFAQARGEIAPKDREEEDLVNRDTLFPTSRDLRENITKPLTGDYLEPKNDWEKGLNEITETFTNLITPTPGSKVFAGAKGFKNLSKEILKKAGSSTAAVGAKNLSKELGGKEGDQEAAHTLALFLGTLFGTTNAQNYASKLISQSEALIPRGARLKSPSLLKGLDKISDSAPFRVGSSPSTQPAINQIDKIRKNIKPNGTIDVQDLVELRKDINEVKRNLGGFEINSPSDKKTAIRHLNEVNDVVRNELDAYGSVNKAFGKANREANAAFATVAQSNSVKEWIKDQIGIEKILDKPSRVLFLPGSAVYPIAHAGALIHRFLKNPTIRKYYVKSMIDALNRNKSSFGKSIDNLNVAIEKQEKFEKDILK